MVSGVVLRVLCLVVGLCSAAVQQDQITKLPGWHGPLPSRQWSGYVTVPESKRHVHYWFVESEGNPAEDPVILWVQGGPGGSSLEGMWTENMGPFALDARSMSTTPPTLERSQYPWTSNASMLFWEAPAGVGFSYCEDGPCPAWNDTTFAIDAAKMLCTWLTEFKEFANQPLYIAGESYAGVYIPVVVLELMRTGMCDSTMNLSGIMIGNGCTGTDAGTCSPARSLFTVKQLYQQAMISEATKARIDTVCADSQGYNQADLACQAALLDASDEAGTYNHYQVHDTCDATGTLAKSLCDLLEPPPAWACKHAGVEMPTLPSSQRLFEVPRADNRVLETPEQPENYFCGRSAALASYLSLSEVQTAIHVRPLPSWPGTGIEYTRSARNLLVSPGMPDIIARFPTLIYSGDFDSQIPHCGTEDWVTGMGYQPIGKPYQPWRLAGSSAVAGRITNFQTTGNGSFVYATVAGAGHMVPTYKAQEARELMFRFINAAKNVVAA